MVKTGDDAFALWENLSSMYFAKPVKIIFSKDVYSDRDLENPKHLVIGIDTDNNLYSNCEYYDAEYFDEDGRSLKIKTLTKIDCKFYSKAELKEFIRATKIINDCEIRDKQNENASLAVIAKHYGLE